MEVKSKIKTLFDAQMRRYLAAICDTRQIQNNILKMDLAQRLLATRSPVHAEQIGGATNRYVVMMDGYAIKIAVDRQGYKDNLMEYALTCEVPHTTKSYETNGYALIQQCVRIVTLEEWRLRKMEILRILEELSRDYLLGDVGYDDVNRTNWGITDDGELVIVDYAYCHRLTEDLFTCPVCGAVLTYDQNFTSFLCSDRANCHARYTYNQIKARQGDAVDWNMIKEKMGGSLVIPKGETSIEVERSDDKLLDSSTMIIKSYQDIAKYKEVKNMLTLDYTDPQVMSLITELTVERALASPDRGRLEELQAELDKLREKVPEIKCIIDPEFEETLLEDGYTVSGDQITRREEPKKERGGSHVLSYEELVEKALAENRNNHNSFAEVRQEPEIDHQRADTLSKLVDRAMSGRTANERMEFTERTVTIADSSQGMDEEGGNVSVEASVTPTESPVAEEQVSPSVQVQRRSPQPVPEPERMAPPVTEEIEGLEEEELIEPIEEEGDYEQGDDTSADYEGEGSDTEEGKEEDGEEEEDAIGEPDSELDSAVEEALPSAPDGDDASGFITEPVVDDGPTDDLPLEVAEPEEDHKSEPETVVIDDAYLASDGADAEEVGEEEEIND